MKKSILLLCISGLAIGSTVSCKKKDTKQELKEKTFTVDTNKTAINWTAFKTTDKIPVKGKFTKLNLKNSIQGKTPKEALHGLEFSIPVSSLFSNSADRDHKLKTLFFGVMKNTELLSGIIYMNTEISGYVDFSMNGIVEKLPFSYSVTENLIQIKTIMNTDTWQAQSALESLNQACLHLHKGADGISKTWSDVAIDISVYFK